MVIYTLKATKQYVEGGIKMVEREIDLEDVKSVFKGVGVQEQECNKCVRWTSPELDKPLTRSDTILAELTPGEEGFLRCMDYLSEEKVVDTIRLRALYETFWGTVRSVHDLPLEDLTVREGKYIVAM